MKTKTEHLGKYVVIYNGNYETAITVTEDTAKDHVYWTNKGLGYLFEENTPKTKYTGVENTKKEKDSE